MELEDVVPLGLLTEMTELRQKMESWQDCLTPKEGEVASYSDLSANQEKVSTDVNNCNQ